jgi:hypothetical protein
MKTMLKKIWGLIKHILEPIGKTIFAIVSFVLLLLVYILGIGPVSIISKIFGRHFLELKNQYKKSNWHDHNVTKEPIKNYYRTF